MQHTGVRGNRVYYYGNAAGYIDNGKAIIDTMFQNDELAEWLQNTQKLALEYREGVYDRLAAGAQTGHSGHALPIPQTCRIWQLKPEVDPRIKFIGYDELEALTDGPPDPANYRLAYECETSTDDLDDIYERFRDRQPPGFHGNPIALSDVIEICGEDGSEFHYIDKSEFIEISFAQAGQEQRQQMHL